MAGKDIITAIREDHQEVRELLASIENAHGKERKQLFEKLVNELIRHEVAEEEILRPVSKRLAGESIVKERLEEEHKAERLLSELEKLEPDSPQFEQAFMMLMKDVQEHALAEETEEHPKVQMGTSLEEREKMGMAFEAAKKTAPTHPHPKVPNTPVATTMAGPFAAIIDRTRDAIRNAMEARR